MKRTFNIQLVMGNNIVTLEGATGYSIATLQPEHIKEMEKSFKEENQSCEKVLAIKNDEMSLNMYAKEQS